MMLHDRNNQRRPPATASNRGKNHCILLLMQLITIQALLCLNIIRTISIADAANVAINNRTVEDWDVVDLEGRNTYKPMFVNQHSVVPHDEVSHWPVNTYYWKAPEAYYQWKIYTYGGNLTFLVNHIVTRGDTSGKYLDEPDLVLEGGPKDHHMKIGYRLPKEDDMLRGYDKNQTINMPLSEPGWFYLVEEEEQSNESNNNDNNNNNNIVKRLKLGDTPVSRADFSLVLAGLDRSLIRAKYHMDQVEGDLYDVNMHLFNNRSRTVECDNDCSGALLDDLDDIGLLFDEIRRLAPQLKDGPWRRLAYLSELADSLGERLSHYLKLIALGKEVIVNYAQNFDMETLADLLELRASNLDARAPQIAHEAWQTRLWAERTLEELLKGLWDKIRKIIKLLEEHGNGPSGVSPGRIERIVQEAEIILRELRNRNLRPYLDDAERELRRAKQLLDKIRTLLIDPDKSAELLKRLEQLNKILVDFSRIVQEQVLVPVEQANELVSEGKKRYALILALLKEAEERAKESQNFLDDARRMLDITRKCLADEAAYLDQLPRQLSDLNQSIHEIEVKRSILTQVNPEYQRKYVDKCRDHSEFLIKKAKELDGLFNATRDVADYALRAANVYKNIAAAIDEAEKAAKRADEAAEKAYKKAVPDFDESLADKAREAKRKSLELLERAKRLRDQDVQRLSLELAKRKQTIDQLFEEMKQLARELDQINAGLKQLADKNIMEQLQALDEFLKRLLERIADIHRRLQLLGDLIYNSLLPQFERLSVGSQSSLGNLSQVIDLARKDLQAAIKYSSTSRQSLNKLLELEAKLDLDVDLLRRKIQLAHQEAASVHISVMPSGESQLCTRSYFIPALLSAPLEGGTGCTVGGFNIRRLELIWSIHSGEPGAMESSLLLFIGSKSSPADEFLALEMYERHIRFVYSLNSYPVQELVHPLKIELNDKGLLSDEAWYLISVECQSGGSSDQLRLSVRPVPKAHERDQQQVSHRLTPNLIGGAGSSSARLVGSTTPYGEADINFYVGGLPPNNEFSPPNQLKSSRLAGCLYHLSLNEQPVGLWNFKSSQGCEGCMEGASLSRDTGTFSLSGQQSYSTVSQSRNYDPARLMVSMSVKSHDSDSLLFLSISESSRHYVSVFLRKGRVAYLVGKLPPSTMSHAHTYPSLSSTSLFDLYAQSSSNLSTTSTATTTTNNQQPPLEHIIMTNREYNNNQWFKITAEKDQNKLVLAVEDEFLESIVDDKLLHLDTDQIFFGGVWPLIKPRHYASTSLELQSFAGCLKDIQIETSSVDLLRRQSHGVQTGCQAAAAAASSAGGRLAGGPQVAYPLPAGRK